MRGWIGARVDTRAPQGLEVEGRSVPRLLLSAILEATPTPHFCDVCATGLSSTMWLVMGRGRQTELTTPWFLL